MKTTATEIGFTIAIIFILIVVFLGTYAQYKEGNLVLTPNGDTIQKVTIDGHDYFQSSSGALTHSESCHCKK